MISTRSLHQNAKNQVKLISQAKKLSSPTSTVVSSKQRENQKATQPEESPRKVMYLSCWEIHDLLQEMAFSIVRAESKFPGKRSRLCHLPDVVHVMVENKGTEEIEGMSLDISKLSRQIHLKPDAFAMMDGLRFLKFYFGHFSEDNKDKMLLPPTGLQYLSNKLIYLHWDGFPSISLPQNFCAEHLIELNLSRSKVEKLWTGVQDIGNLRNFVLSFSPYLIELPDLSKAKNLVRLYLVDCSSLTEVPSSLQHLDKLEELDLYFCYNLRRFPMLDSKVLRVLAISRCLDMTKFPTISQDMKRLYLEETSLKEVPQSVTSKLEHLGLHGCSNITKFPDISGDIKTLYLSETAITEVPSSIQFLKKLRVLDMSGCSNLESFPEITVPMKSLVDLNLSKTGIKEIPSSFKHMISLRSLGLDGTPIKELPLSIKDMSGEKIPYDRIQMILPGSEIPEWFGDKGIGSSLTIQLPSNCHQLKGIAFCLVFLLPLPSYDMLYGFDDHPEVRIYFDCHIKSKNVDDDEVFVSKKSYTVYNFLKTCESDHMFLHYELGFIDHFRKYSGNEVTFKFYNEVENGKTKVGHDIRKPCKLKSCAVYLHFDENLRADTLLRIFRKKQKLRRNLREEIEREKGSESSAITHNTFSATSFGYTMAGFSSLAPNTKNLVVAGGLSAFVFGVYFYTMRAVGGTDELQTAIDKFEQQKSKQESEATIPSKA
ncbi:hypothetical protein SADUNF_Sadunf19G0099700 [Salix dunnii]|uniref:C-JID domain-containing protein n=1 Tax=Salix dunnii TaxID=1413687 RepID=A0A835J237_9ROSI|nr:hypothetical protein SADUNF_Sadunf19G0099700 [Salix dunnii]